MLEYSRKLINRTMVDYRPYFFYEPIKLHCLKSEYLCLKSEYWRGGNCAFRHADICFMHRECIRFVKQLWHHQRLDFLRGSVFHGNFGSPGFPDPEEIVRVHRRRRGAFFDLESAVDSGLNRTKMSIIQNVISLLQEKIKEQADPSQPASKCT